MGNFKCVRPSDQIRSDAINNVTLRTTPALLLLLCYVLALSFGLQMSARRRNNQSWE